MNEEILVRRYEWHVGHEYRAGDSTLIVRCWEPTYRVLGTGYEVAASFARQMQAEGKVRVLQDFERPLKGNGS